jgi:hypothetical protein
VHGVADLLVGQHASPLPLARPEAAIVEGEDVEARSEGVRSPLGGNPLLQAMQPGTDQENRRPPAPRAPVQEPIEPQAIAVEGNVPNRHAIEVPRPSVRATALTGAGARGVLARPARATSR